MPDPKQTDTNTNNGSGKAQTDKSDRVTKEIEQRKEEYREWKEKKK